MAGTERQTRGAPNRPPASRHPGWVVLVGMLATVCLVIGLVMLAMLEAPGVRRGVIVTSCALIAAGALLAPIAWFGRPGGDTRRPAMTIEFDLTDSQRVGLESLSEATGRTPQQLLSDAVDRLLEENDAVD